VPPSRPPARLRPPGTDTGATTSATDSGATTNTTDSGGTSDSGTTTDSGGTAVAERWEPWSLRNDLEDCFIDNPVYPGRSEWGHLGAAKLVPADGDFKVESVSYVLATAEADAACDDSLAHRVELWAQADGTPDASPALLDTLDVPASAAFGPGASRDFSHTLDAPVTVAQGEVLFVAVELAGTPQGVGCVMTCASTTADASNYWSNATAAPYAWEELINYDLPGNYKIRVAGQQETSGLERTCDDGGDEDKDGLTDCEDPDCVDDAACVICTDGDLGSATGAGVATGTTVDAQGDHLLSCALEDAAGDVGWSWTAPSTGTWQFQATSPDGGTLAVGVFDACGGTELGCDYKNVDEAAVQQGVAEGESVLVVVKAVTFPWAGEYVLDITAVE